MPRIGVRALTESEWDEAAPPSSPGAIFLSALLLPVAVFAVTLAAAVGSVLVFESFQVVGALVALYTVARHCDRTTSLGAVGAGVVASVIPAVAKGPEDPLFATVAGVGFVVVWAVGRRAG